MNCIFFGSPEFACASLERLLKSSHTVLGVITQPDRPAGRRLQLEAPAVKKLALQYNLPILQPEKINTPQVYQWIQEKNPDALTVVAYGEFLGETLLKICPLPPINVHPSLLPSLRGAAPIQWALLNGFTHTGVSTQFMVKEMDAGDILLQETTTIEINENSQHLQDRLSLVGANLLVQTLDLLEKKELQPQPQNHTEATLAPLLSKEQSLIHWKKSSAQSIHNQIRGLFPWPGTYALLAGKRVKILSSLWIQEKNLLPPYPLKPGNFCLYGELLFVQANDRCLAISKLQPEGKKPLLPKEFMNGIKGALPNDGFYSFDS